jgi:hypothetical protein
LTCLDRTIDSWYRSATPTDPSTGRGGGTGADSISTAARSASGAVRRRATRAHLNALALGELAGLLLTGAALGTQHRQRPHLIVTVNLADYAAGLGGALRLPGYGDSPVAGATADRISCDAHLTTAITRTIGGSDAPRSATHDDHARDDDDDAMDRGGDSHELDRLAEWLREQSREVLYVGRSERTAPPRLRRALEIRDGGCVAPGCAVDPSRCEAHHVTPWSRGGGTDLDGMALMCTGHHHLVHEGGWTLAAAPGHRPGETGYWRLHPPRPQP